MLECHGVHVHARTAQCAGAQARPGPAYPAASARAGRRDRPGSGRALAARWPLGAVRRVCLNRADDAFDSCDVRGEGHQDLTGLRCFHSEPLGALAILPHRRRINTVVSALSPLQRLFAAGVRGYLNTVEAHTQWKPAPIGISAPSRYNIRLVQGFIVYGSRSVVLCTHAHTPPR